MMTTIVVKYDEIPWSCAKKAPLKSHKHRFPVESLPLKSLFCLIQVDSKLFSSYLISPATAMAS